MYELMVEDTFHAAHALAGYEGPCENLHGHSFKVQIFVRGQTLDKVGLLQDFKALKVKLKEILANFDHKHLNAIKPFDQQNPSSENLAKNIFTKLKETILSLHKVVVWESQTASAAYWEEK